MTEEAPVLTVSNTAMENGTVTYSSSDEKVATIDNNGKITLVGKGEVTFTVTFPETANYNTKQCNNK